MVCVETKYDVFFFQSSGVHPWEQCAFFFFLVLVFLFFVELVFSPLLDVIECVAQTPRWLCSAFCSNTPNCPTRCNSQTIRYKSAVYHTSHTRSQAWTCTRALRLKQCLLALVMTRNNIFLRILLTCGVTDHLP